MLRNMLIVFNFANSLFLNNKNVDTMSSTCSGPCFVPLCSLLSSVVIVHCKQDACTTISWCGIFHTLPPL